MPRDVWLFTGAQSLWGVGYGILGPVWPLYVRELGATPQEIGLVFGLANVLATTAFVPGGLLADRIGRKPLLVATWICSTAGAALLLPLREWQGALVGTTLYWVGALSVPLLSAQLAGIAERRVLGLALGLVFGAYWFGNILSAPFAGVIAAAVGFRGAIAVAVLAFVASTALIVGARALPASLVREPLRFPRGFWPLLGVTPFVALLSIIALALLPVYLRDVAAVPLERIGIYGAVVALGAAVLQPVAGRFADEFGPTPALFATATVLSGGAALIMFSGKVEPLILVSAFLLGATQAAVPILAAAIERMVPRARITVGYGIYQLAFAIGFGAGGAIAGSLYEADPLLPFLTTAALALPIAALAGTVVSRSAGRPASSA